MTSTAAEIAMLDATGQAALVRDGEVAAAELVEGAIERIERLNPALGAVVTTLYDHARAAVAAGPSGPFAGVPYLLKDLVVEIEGTPFHEGSEFLRGNVSTFTSELVHRLRRAGLVVLGRANTGPPATRGTRSARPADRAADRQLPSRRGWCRWPTATTSAGRCASPR